jgi:hypothetical protein
MRGARVNKVEKSTPEKFDSGARKVQTEKKPGNFLQGLDSIWLGDKDSNLG